MVLGIMIMSHPVWVRGLKQCSIDFAGQPFSSHPVWVRGLKQHNCSRIFASGGVAPRVGAWIETRGTLKTENEMNVAPRVGAWIETSVPSCESISAESHPVWVRGLKPLVPDLMWFVVSRTPCGCVD